MSETMDYAPVLNAMEPPEGLVHWVLGQGKLQHEVLLYKAGWAYEPLEDRNVPVVEVTCSGCGRTFHARKITAGGCCSSYAPAPFGWWNELTGEAVISGSHSTCPYCSTAAEVKHVSAVPGGVDQYAFVTEIRRTPGGPGERDRLALVDWQVSRHIDKRGQTSFHIRPWTAWVVEEKKIVRLMGYTRCISSLSRHPLEQRKTFLDDYGQAGLVWPWDAGALTGTTAENCKLDLFLAQGGTYLVGYLALWRKKPAVENLVTSGMGELVNALIGEEGKTNSYGRSRGIPKLPDLHWKEVKPHRILGLSREELRAWAGKLTPKDLRLVAWARGAGLTVDLEKDLEKLRYLGRSDAEQLLKTAGARRFWRSVRYLIGNGKHWWELRDYWNMAAKLEMDLDSDQVRYPKDLKAAHDRAVERFNLQKDQLVQAGFDKRRAELEKFAWERDGILIRPCASQTELRHEGKCLSHCVASYAQDHALGKTAILFIRRASEPDKPWYTLELDEKTLSVRQNRGKRNCDRTEEITAFEEAWLEHIRAEFGKKKQRAGRPAKRQKGANAA